MADGEKLLPSQGSPERRPDGLAEAAGERLEQLKKSPENNAEHDRQSQERAVEHARKQAELEAVFGKEAGGEAKAGGESGGEPAAPAPVTKKVKEQEYDKTLSSVQDELSTPAKSFSKVIHNPTVEKTSEAVGSTIARPNLILSGSITAFIAVLGVYALAKYNGFPLSGFETIGAFVIGWLVGAVIDLLRVAFMRGRTA